MGRTVRDLSPDELEAYRKAWKDRQAAKELALRGRAERAITIALEASRILKKEFGARRVWLFGSLVRGTFGVMSDIDLAVEGLPANRFYQAVGRLQGLDPDMAVDLVDIQETRPAIRRSIDLEGVLL